MNKPLTIIGLILIILGVILVFYVIEFIVSIIIGILAVIVGIALDIGKFSKRAVLGKETLIYCVKCGSSIRANAKFCGYCGEEIK